MLNLLTNFENGLVILIQRFLGIPFLDWFFPFYTDLHKEPWFVLTFTMPVIFLWVYLEGKKRIWIIAGFFMTVIITDTFCGQLVKKAIGRVRPFEASASIVALSPASGFSFVSNHAANSFAIATYLAYFYPKASWVFWVLASFTAFSRIYNGVHYPTDVIVGAMIGYIFSKLVIKYFVERKLV
jgi:undecaprenyl-diphosphatase